LLSKARKEVMIDWVADDDANYIDGVKIVATLLADDALVVKPESKIVEGFVLLSIRHQCNLVFNMLLDRWQSGLTLDRTILKNAVARGGPVIIKRPLDLPAAPVITDLAAAAGSKNEGTTVVHLLLDRCDGHLNTESVVKAAAVNLLHRHYILPLLLDKYDAAIPDSVMKVAESDREYWAKPTLTCLRERQALAILILGISKTESVRFPAPTKADRIRVIEGHKLQPLARCLGLTCIRK
jgi:hypothetical protein